MIDMFGSWEEQEEQKQQRLQIKYSKMFGYLVCFFLSPKSNQSIDSFEKKWISPPLWGDALPAMGSFTMNTYGKYIFIFGGFDGKVCFNKLFTINHGLYLRCESLC